MSDDRSLEYEFRDAREEDAPRLAQIANEQVLNESLSAESMRELVHERTIVVAVRENEGQKKEENGEEVVGYVSYEARMEFVVVQHLAVIPECEPEVLERLLEFPIEFADSEVLKTRIVSEKEDSETRSLVERYGFEHKRLERFGDREMIVFERGPEQK